MRDNVRKLMIAGGKREAFASCPDDELVIYAARAFHEGNANEGQQHMLFDWLVHVAARTQDLSFRPGGEDGQRFTDFMEGRRYVGFQLLRLLQPEMTPQPKEEKNDDGKA